MRRPRTTFTARTPADLVAVVPHLLGFRPEDSVVLVTFGTPGECFHARVDLPAGVDDQAAVAALLTDVVTRHAIPRVALLVYTEDARTAASFHDVAVPVFVDAGVEILDVLRVGPGRIHRACDPDDPGVPYDLSSHPFTAEQVVRGRVVHGSRAELAATLDRIDPADAEVVARAAGRQTARLRRVVGFVQPGHVADALAEDALWLHHLVRRHAALGAPLSAGDAGRLLALVAVDELRDGAWTLMTREDADRHVDLWRDLVRRAPRELLPAAASLLAFAAWLDGDGALAWCALDRVAAVDPGYRMAGFVGALLERAVPPSTWELVDPADPPAAS
jgi:hypothetical protein